MFDENEDIALTFCDEKNINHITFDKYVAKMTVELKLIQNQLTKTNKQTNKQTKKKKVPFLSCAAVYYGQLKQVTTQNLVKKRKIPA